MRAVRLVALAAVISAFFAEVAFAIPSFTVSPPISLPRTVVDIAVGRLNGDSIDDIAVVSRGTNKVSILLIEPDGSFRQGASLNVGSRLKAVGIGDFNGDDKGDLAVATGTRNLWIITGNGDGTFGTPIPFRRVAPSGDIIVGDFDQSRPGAPYGDDIAIANPSKDDISVIINNNAQSVTPSFKNGPRLRAGNKPQYLVGTDLNNDGKLDIAALNILGVGNDISVFLNQSVPGNPQREVNFMFTANFFAGKRSRSVASGELSRDGNIDLVAGDQRDNSLVFLPNLGGGLFGTETAVPVSCVLDAAVTPVPCTIRQVAIADFDCDTSFDVSVLLSNLDIIRVFSGSVGGGFQNPTRVLSIGRKVRIMKLGNFNSDSRIDMAVVAGGDNSLRLILNTSACGGPEATFTNTPTGPTRTPTPTSPFGGSPSPTPTACVGQGCPCDPANGDDDCLPFFCSEDEVCCDTPCNDLPNLSCDLPGSVGTCQQTDLPDGEPCVSPEQCQSGFCVHGVCCESECSGATQRCDINPGQCLSNQTPAPTATATATPVGGGSNSPTRTRTPTIRLKELGEDCAAGSECNSTFCPLEDLVCCNEACNGSNEQCDLPGVRGQCLPINLRDVEDFVVDAQCISEVCEGGTCAGTGAPTRTRTPTAPSATPTGQRQPTGALCTQDQECESGHCPEDGVCCDTECSGTNERCDIPGAVGRCLPIDLPDAEPCDFDQQCRSQDCDGDQCRGNDPVPTIVLTTRSPTPTRTATPPRGPTVIAARGSGCSTGDGSGGFGGVALLLALPLWLWLSSSRVPAKVRRKRPRH